MLFTYLHIPIYLFSRHNGDLFKHLSMTHFAQRIWKENLKNVPKDKRPFSCTLCDYTNNSSVQLTVHVGVVHKMAIKYHFEVLNVQEKNWGSSSGLADPVHMHSKNVNAAPTGGTPPSSGGFIPVAAVAPQVAPPTPVRPPPPPKPPTSNNTKAAKCPVCEEVLPHPGLLFHVAQHHFSQQLGASRVPTKAPYKCPICPHHAEDYGAILRHFLIYHNQMELLTQRLKNPDLPVPEPKVGLKFSDLLHKSVTFLYS